MAMTRGTIKYGYVKGRRALLGNIPMGNGEIFDDTGAKFIKMDGAGYFDTLDGGNETIFGWAEVGAFTCGADGKTLVTVDTSCESIYYIPADAAVSVAGNLIGKTGSIVRDTNRQRFDVATNAGDTVFVVGIDVPNQAVYVKINPAPQHETAIT